MRAFVSGLPVKASDFARGFDTDASAEREEFSGRLRAGGSETAESRSQQPQ